MLFLRPSLLTLLMASACLPLAAGAGCSRPINVPVAPIGMSVTVKGQDVGGVFPELLNRLGAAAGCQFKWTVVPRARLEAMFELGSADLIVAATHSERRDQLGLFIPMITSRATLVGLAGARPPLHSMAQLLAQKQLRVALVRGYDYGPAYLELSRQLAEQGRLMLEPDPVSVARLLQGGMVDVTILPPSALIGAIKTDSRVEGLAGRLRVEPLDELPWSKSGVYLSNKSLAPADRALLEQMLAEAGKSGALWDAYKRYYSPEILNDSTRPL